MAKTKWPPKTKEPATKPIIVVIQLKADRVTFSKRPPETNTPVSIAELSQYLDFGIEKGVLIVQVVPGGSADLAGLRGGNRTAIIGRYRLPVGGDIITAIDDYPISEIDDIDRLLKKKKVGEIINLRIHRNDRLMEIPVTLMERP